MHYLTASRFSHCLISSCIARCLVSSCCARVLAAACFAHSHLRILPRFFPPSLLADTRALSQVLAALTRVAALGNEFELPADDLLPAVIAVVERAAEDDVHESVVTAALELGAMLLAYVNPAYDG